MGFDEEVYLALQRGDLARQAADVRELFAGDPDSCCGRHRAKAPVDTVKHHQLVKRSELH
jgi:hypothetical protein